MDKKEYPTIIDISDCKSPEGLSEFNPGDLVVVRRPYVHKAPLEYSAVHQYLYETGTICEVVNSGQWDGSKWLYSIKLPKRIWAHTKIASRISIAPEYLDAVYF